MASESQPFDPFYKRLPVSGVVSCLPALYCFPSSLCFSVWAESGLKEPLGTCPFQVSVQLSPQCFWRPRMPIQS